MASFLSNKKNQKKFKRIIPFAIGALLFSFLLTFTSTFRKIELSFYDLALSTKHTLAEKRDWDIVIVDITDQADDEIPDVWPWPRTHYAHLVENLFKAGAKAIGFDIEMNMNRPEDSVFAKSIQKFGNVILAVKVIGDNGRAAKRLVEPSKALQTDKTVYGHVNIDNEIDGIIRQYWSSIEYSGEKLESIALALYNITHSDKQNFPPFWIDFYGPARTLPYVSFELVIDDSTFTTTMEKEFGEKINSFENDILQEKIFKDKIVIVGSSMENLHDIKLTPLDPNTPGVEIHATALQSMIDRRFITESPEWFTNLIIFLTIIFIATISLRFSTNKSILILLLYIALFIFASLFIFSNYALFFNAIKPIAYAFWLYLGFSLALYIIEKNDRQMITSMFSHYLPSTVVSELINNPERMKLGGEKREMSVLFSDVEGFTTISEGITPEALVALLNEYLSAMSEIVFDNGGIIDKYEGDAIMAEFGMPLKVKDHALRACKTAIQMQEELYKLRTKLEKEGRPGLKARIGVSSGDMIFGNMGSHKIFDYTVMGDTVNLGSRLEGANKAYGTRIMINERTFELVKEEVYAREMDLLRVKGKQLPVKIYQLISLKESAKKENIETVITLFEEGLKLYRLQDWDGAISFFSRVLQIWDDDAPARIFIDRCFSFKNSPPPADWDGVYTLTEK